MRKSLRQSSGIISHMTTAKDIRTTVAKNVKFFMARPSSEFRTANALAVAAGLAANSVRYLIEPERRPTTTEKGVGGGWPGLETLAAVAPFLKCELWELLHPNIERSQREREAYALIETDILLKLKRP